MVLHELAVERTSCSGDILLTLTMIELVKETMLSKMTQKRSARGAFRAMAADFPPRRRRGDGEEPSARG